MTKALTSSAKNTQGMMPPELGPESLLQQAIAAGADIGTIERLMALRQSMLAEKAKEAFNRAMAAFQAECPVIKKTKEVKTNAGKVAYRYAPIESTISQVKKLVEKHGFRYSTSMHLGEGKVKVTCRIVHELGHEELSEMEVPLGGKTEIMSQSQVVAAASTFAKRYAFLNAFGIMTGDEDTDGAIPDNPPPKTAAAQAPLRPAASAPVAAAPAPKTGYDASHDRREPPSAIQLRKAHAEWNEFMRDKNITDVVASTENRRRVLTQLFGIDTMDDITKSQCSHFIDQIISWRKAYWAQKRTETPPAPKTAAPPAEKTPTLETEIQGYHDWIDAASDLDELAHIWDIAKVDQVRFKAAKVWTPLLQYYMDRRAAIKVKK